MAKQVVNKSTLGPVKQVPGIELPRPISINQPVFNVPTTGIRTTKAK